jgi:hypothetical protein
VTALVLEFSLYAAQAAGTAALLGLVGDRWVIVIVIALVRAELGSMYSIAGGTARFPHFPFGSIAGTSFGFFSWLQAITVSPFGGLARSVLLPRAERQATWRNLSAGRGPGSPDRQGLLGGRGQPIGPRSGPVIGAVSQTIAFL